MTMLRLLSDDQFFPFSRDPPLPKSYHVMLLLISLVLIQSCNRHATRENINKPSKQAKRRECLPRAVSQQISYIPQMTQGKQIGNRKQTFWKNKIH